MTTATRVLGDRQIRVLCPLHYFSVPPLLAQNGKSRNSSVPNCPIPTHVSLYNKEESIDKARVAPPPMMIQAKNFKCGVIVLGNEFLEWSVD